MWWGKGGVDQNNGHGGGAYVLNATYICHAFAPWQRAVADAVGRTISDSGPDGIRLDGCAPRSVSAAKRRLRNTKRLLSTASATFTTSSAGTPITTMSIRSPTTASKLTSPS